MSWNYTPGAWTRNCIAKPPAASQNGLDENAHKGMIGKVSSAAMQIALRRPILSENVPKHSPPMMPPML